jgi:hypothetical protein
MGRDDMKTVKVIGLRTKKSGRYLFCSFTLEGDGLSDYTFECNLLDEDWNVSSHIKVRFGEHLLFKDFNERTEVMTRVNSLTICTDIKQQLHDSIKLRRLLHEN